MAETGPYRPAEEIAARLPSVQPALAWRDIATAPRDGTRVDLWADGHRFTDCLWGEWPDRSCWCSLVGIGVPAYPTHWMPIPGAPR